MIRIPRPRARWTPTTRTRIIGALYAIADWLGLTCEEGSR